MSALGRRAVCMAITYRPMRARDVRECVDIVARDFALGPRYGDTIRDLKAVWLGLLGREAFRAVVFEDSQHSGTKIVGVGVSAFVSDDVLQSLRRPPFFWIGPELTRRITRGDAQLLSDRKVREANANGGLNLITWEGVLREDFRSVEALTTLFSAFVEQHRGFLLKEVTCQGGLTREDLDAILRSGGLLVDEDGRYVESIDRSLDDIFKMPHHVGLTRELALCRAGTWIGSLFAYQAPRCGFRPSEQRLLLAAQCGRTDHELATDLGISLSAVKKTWLSIYNRVSAHLPSLFPNRAAVQEEGERGTEKKRHLIAYLRDHPEELRPASL
jgi:hypothetical protein